MAFVKAMAHVWEDYTLKTKFFPKVEYYKYKGRGISKDRHVCDGE